MAEYMRRYTKLKKNRVTVLLAQRRYANVSVVTSWIQSRYNNNNNNNKKAVVNIILRPRCAICCDCIHDDKVKYRMELRANTLKMLVTCCSAVSTRLLPTPRAIITRYMKTWRHQQNRKYITYWLSSENDWATAIGDMYREFREVWMMFMRYAGGQTDIQVRSSQHFAPYRGRSDKKWSK